MKTIVGKSKSNAAIGVDVGSGKIEDFKGGKRETLDFEVPIVVLTSAESYKACLDLGGGWKEKTEKKKRNNEEFEHFWKIFKGFIYYRKVSKASKAIKFNNNTLIIQLK